MLIDVRKIATDCIAKQHDPRTSSGIDELYVHTLSVDLREGIELEVFPEISYECGKTFDRDTRYDVWMMTTLTEDYLRIYHLIGNTGTYTASPVYFSEYKFSEFCAYHPKTNKNLFNNTYLIMSGISNWWSRYDLKRDRPTNMTIYDFAMARDIVSCLREQANSVDQLWIDANIAKYPVMSNLYHVCMTDTTSVDHMAEHYIDWIAELLAGCRRDNDNRLILSDQAREGLAHYFYADSHFWRNLPDIDQKIIASGYVNILDYANLVTPIQIDPIVAEVIFGPEMVRETVSDPREKFGLNTDFYYGENGETTTLFAWVATAILIHNLQICSFDLMCGNEEIQYNNIQFWDLVEMSEEQVVSKLIEPFIEHMTIVADEVFATFKGIGINLIHVERCGDRLSFTTVLDDGTVEIDVYSLTLHMLTGNHLLSDKAVSETWETYGPLPGGTNPYKL